MPPLLTARALAADTRIPGHAAGNEEGETMSGKMRRFADWLNASLAAVALAGGMTMSAAAGAAGGIVDVVEYYHAGLDHYFITGDPAEVAALDGGAAGGAWRRTGSSFNAWEVAGAPAGTVPVCRFFGTDRYRPDGTRIGPNSHFYTADPAECNLVRTAWQSVASDGVSYPAWTFERYEFAVLLPVNGSCPSGTLPLYRTYNNGARGDPNHRYSTNAGALQAMAGWSFEGLVMCLPGGSTAPVDIRGEIRGCTTPDCRPPSSFGSGMDLVDVVVEFGNAGGAPITVSIPSGFVFVSSSGTFQDGLLLDSVNVTVPASGSVRVLLSLYCLQQDRAAATADAVYRWGELTTNPGILAILGVPRPHGVADGSVSAMAVQFSLWEVTNGKGALSAAQLGLLGNVLAAPEMSAEQAMAAEQLFQSLSVMGGG